MLLARALYRNKSVLFMDESLSALDASLRRKILEDIVINYPDMTVFYISHNAEDHDVFKDHLELIRMKIAFYVPNAGLRKIDFSRPQDGNPGTGAAEYLHVALPYYINCDKIEAQIYAQDITHMPQGMECVECDSIRDAAHKASSNGIDIFVFRPRINEEDSILDLIDELKLPSIGRAALTQAIQHQRKMARSKYFKALVAVGSEQYDYMCDSPLAHKLTHIDNGISHKACQAFQNEKKNTSLVSYMGAIVPQKVFMYWRKYGRRLSAKYPMLSYELSDPSKIYNENYKVGPLGIADEAYEKEHIIPYLCDSDGELLPSQ